MSDLWPMVAYLTSHPLLFFLLVIPLSGAFGFFFLRRFYLNRVSDLSWRVHGSFFDVAF